MNAMRLALLTAIVLSARVAVAQETPLDLRKLFTEGIPPSPFANVFYRYADGLIASERDDSSPVPQNALRLLYFLRGLSGKDDYPRAADASLRGRLAGEFSDLRHTRRPWMLWPRCFELDAEASLRAARRAVEELAARPDRSRQIGFLLRTCAEAWQASADRDFLAATHEIIASWDERLPSDPAGRLSIAIDADGAAAKLPPAIRARLGRLAAREDARFLALDHEPGSRGFVLAANARTPLWSPGFSTTASVAVLCMSRYENRGAVAYRDLVVAAADAYLDSLPGEDVEAWPLTFAAAITVELAAFRFTSDERYFRRAFELGEVAVARYFPTRGDLARRASTGRDSLALALAELHLVTRTITAVRTPANTIDR